MKALIKISNIRSENDVNRIRTALGAKEGVVACHIKVEKGEVEVVYDRYFINEEKMNDLLEDMGYTKG